jgi:1-acyl-sn-glycerol-3-phosphate acyltransferase
MTLLRNAIFYLFVGLVVAVFLPAPLLARARPALSWPLTRAYLSLMMWGFAHICSLRFEIRGMENLPAGACLIASGQQSLWENVSFSLIFGNPAILTKTEVFRRLTAGWVLRANDHIPIDRGGDLASLKAGIENARRQIAAGRSVLIFPEGTRNTVPGQAVLRKGVGVFYAVLDRPCVPVVLNSGQYWPYGTPLIRSGTITVEVLEPIEPGLKWSAFEQRLKAVLDAGALRLADAAPRSAAR